MSKVSKNIAYREILIEGRWGDDMCGSISDRGKSQKEKIVQVESLESSRLRSSKIELDGLDDHV